jgi:hypothetical protein
MRGGAIAPLAWGTLLLVLFIGNAVWNGRAISAAVAAFAAIVIYAIGLLLWLARRESIKRGPPPPRSEPEKVPEHSLAAALSGLSVAAILFGLVWANFLVYFGVATLVASLGRVALELRAERSSRRSVDPARRG